MKTIQTVEPTLEDLIDAQKPNHSLGQEFYIDKDIYQKDMEHLVSEQWLLIDHESRIKQRGEYFLFEIGDESIIIIRGEEDKVYAHYNVCSHRGSRICLEKEGRKNLMVCPYHAWSYRQDGSLQRAPYMPDDFDCNKVSLKSCHVKVCEGLIFICLSDTPPDFEANIQGIDAYFKLHSTSRCKVAHRHTFETVANWKLVVENFVECYHCLAAHPELCSVRTKSMVIGAGAGPSSGDSGQEGFSEEMQMFEERAKELEQLPEIVDDYDGDQWYRWASRAPLKDGCPSESEDGQPIAPLLKGFKDWDNGYTGLTVNPLSHMLATSDAVFLFRFTPRSTELTDAEVIWLVNDDAEEGKDYDLDRLKWAWETTAAQDLTITQNNFAGVKSKAYNPHLHSVMEANVSAFCRWYLANLKKSI